MGREPGGTHTGFGTVRLNEFVSGKFSMIQKIEADACTNPTGSGKVLLPESNACPAHRITRAVFNTGNCLQTNERFKGLATPSEVLDR